LGNSSGGGSDDNSSSIALDASGHVHVAGYFLGPTITFGSTVLANADNTGSTGDIFIAKLDNAVGIDELTNENAFQIYPNPGNGNFTLQTIVQQFHNSTVIISNILGEKISEQKIASSKTEINLSGQTSGIYFVQLKNDKQTITKKLVLNK